MGKFIRNLTDKYILLICIIILLIPLFTLLILLPMGIKVFAEKDFWYAYMAYFGTVVLASVAFWQTKKAHDQTNIANDMSKRLLDLEEREKSSVQRPFFEIDEIGIIDFSESSKLETDLLGEVVDYEKVQKFTKYGESWQLEIDFDNVIAGNEVILIEIGLMNIGEGIVEERLYTPFFDGEPIDELTIEEGVIIKPGERCSIFFNFDWIRKEHDVFFMGLKYTSIYGYTYIQRIQVDSRKVTDGKYIMSITNYKRKGVNYREYVPYDEE